MTEDQIRKAYAEYRKSIGRPAINPHENELSVTYAHFKAGFQAGYRQMNMSVMGVTEKELLEEDYDDTDAL